MLEGGCRGGQAAAAAMCLHACLESGVGAAGAGNDAYNLYIIYVYAST